MITEPTLFDELVKTKPLDRFHNTTSLQGDDLKQREIRAGSQNRKILDFFKMHPYERFTPFEVRDAIYVQYPPITSIRRAITDLTYMGYLVKTILSLLVQAVICSLMRYLKNGYMILSLIAGNLIILIYFKQRIQEDLLNIL